jgi:hypothetical protein
MKSNLDLLNAFRLEIERGKNFKHYIPMLRQARPFNLDEDACRLVADMASGPNHERMVPLYRGLAKLPFEHTWIEFPFPVVRRRQLEIRNINYDNILVPGDKEVLQRLGFLLQEKHDLIYASLIGIDHDNRAYLYPIVYLISTSEAKIHDPREVYFKTPEYAKVLAKMFEENFVATAWSMRNYSELEGYAHVIPEATWAVKFLEQDSMNIDTLVEKLNDINKEAAGTLRLLVSILAVINYVPIIREPYKAPGTMRIGGGVKNFMTNSIVRIQIPNRTRRLRDIERHIIKIDHVSKRRRHEVRGHWRVSNKSHGDKWEMFIDPFTVKIKWRRWINSHERGDASLGWVNQTYVVEKTNGYGQ